MNEFDSTGDSEIDGRLRRLGEALRSERAGCPHPDLLFARRSEVLDRDVRDRLDVHLSTCVACRRLADDVDRIDLAAADAVVEQRVLTRVTGSTRRGHAGLLSLAAALLLVSGLAVTWWSSRRPTGSTPAPVAARPQPAPPGVAPAVVALWTVAPAPVSVPLSSLGATRGGAGEASDGMALVAALSPYQSGDYAGAVVRLLQVVKDFPASGEAHFYLGVSQLMAGHPDAAVVSLERASQLLPMARQPEAEWYLATAEQRVGHVEPARTRLRALCANAGSYQAQACAAEVSLK